MERTHPTYFSLIEQWEQHTQAIQGLKTGEAFIRLPDDSVKRVRTSTLPTVRTDPDQLAALRAYYQDTYFRPFPTPPRRAASAAPPPSLGEQPSISRTPAGATQRSQSVFRAPEPEPTAGGVPDAPVRPISRKPRP